MTVRFGEAIKTELYGSSHGPCIGVRIEGLPAGRKIDLRRLQQFLERRAPGRNAWSTPRREEDVPIFLSGVYLEESSEAADTAGPAEEQASGGAAGVSVSGCSLMTGAVSLVTNGACLQAEIRNTNTRPRDYQHGENAAVIPRPGHADYPAWVKYGRIESGGGQFSARLTAALCIAGGILLQWLEEAGITIAAHIHDIGGIQDQPFDPMADRLPAVDPTFPVLDPEQGKDMQKLIAETKAAGDSVGGSVECMICGLMPGLGEPLFGSIESRICQAVFAVPAVKGIEFGAGFDVADMKGSENNDPYILTAGPIGTDLQQKGEPEIRTASNHHGGILGGLSSGMPLVFRTAMKPTPSIAQSQPSVDLTTMQPAVLEVKGRHDPCIVPRAVPCIEAAAGLAIGDILLQDNLI